VLRPQRDNTVTSHLADRTRTATSVLMFPWRNAGTKPISRNFQFAMEAFGEVHEVNGAAKLIGYQLTDYAGAKP
jgi:hypothetical protein